MRQARLEYLLHGNVSDKAVCYITPRNYTAKVKTFMHTMNLLNLPGHRVLLLMLRTRLYLPGNEWLTAGTGAFVFGRAEAHWCAGTAQRALASWHPVLYRRQQTEHLGRADECRRLSANALDATLDDVSLVFFGKHELGMWTMEDVDATVGLLPMQMRASAARSAANVAAGLEPNAIAGVAGPPLHAPAVTERVREANLRRIQADAAEMALAARRATGRTYAQGERPRAVIFYGVTGAGKSRLARERYAGAFWCDPAPAT